MCVFTSVLCAEFIANHKATKYLTKKKKKVNWLSRKGKWSHMTSVIKTITVNEDLDLNTAQRCLKVFNKKPPHLQKKYAVSVS